MNCALTLPACQELPGQGKEVTVPTLQSEMGNGTWQRSLGLAIVPGPRCIHTQLSIPSGSWDSLGRVGCGLGGSTKPGWLWLWLWLAQSDAGWSRIPAGQRCLCLRVSRMWGTMKTRACGPHLQLSVQFFSTAATGWEPTIQAGALALSSVGRSRGKVGRAVFDSLLALYFSVTLSKFWTSLSHLCSKQGLSAPPATHPPGEAPGYPGGNWGKEWDCPRVVYTAGGTPMASVSQTSGLLLPAKRHIRAPRAPVAVRA